MKFFLKLFVLMATIIVISGINELHASITTFEIVKGEKEFYSVNDTVIVKVKVKNTHRVCTIEISDTKFDQKGVKIIGATKWKSNKSGIVNTRKLKLLIEKSDLDKAVLSATRSCEREGSFGSISFPLKED